MTEPTGAIASDSYHGIAARARELVSADLAAVATVRFGGLIVNAIAGRQPDLHVFSDIGRKLQTWGPVVFDDARLMLAPAIHHQKVAGVLMAYSGQSGRFSGNDLQQLMAFGSSVAPLLEADSAQDTEQGREGLFATPDELFHLSRLTTLGEFAACFSHEVRNALQSIRGNVAYMRLFIKEEDPLRSHLESITRHDKRVMELVERMLNFSRNRPPELTPVPIPELVQDAVRFVEPYLRLKKVSLSLNLGPAMGVALADRCELLQAFVNLMHNAADAMETQTRRLLQVSLSEDSSAARIAIRDTGPGISRADVGRIFDPFFTTKGEHGTGLGLYITRRAVESHGGSITLETGDDGSTFTVSLPIEKPET